MENTLPTSDGSSSVLASGLIKGLLLREGEAVTIGWMIWLAQNRALLGAADWSVFVQTVWMAGESKRESEE